MVKTETRKFLDLLQKGDVSGARDAFSRVQKKLDQVAAKGTLHPNTVARRKARLARRLNAAASASAATG
jgi:small subunit ribosomal protein S20